MFDGEGRVEEGTRVWDTDTDTVVTTTCLVLCSVTLFSVVDTGECCSRKARGVGDSMDT